MPTLETEKAGTVKSPEPKEITPEQLDKFEAMQEKHFAKLGKDGKEDESLREFFYSPVSIFPCHGGFDRQTGKDHPDVPKFLVQKFYRNRTRMTTDSQGNKEQVWETCPTHDDRGRLIDSDASFSIACVDFVKQYKRLDL